MVQPEGRKSGGTYRSGRGGIDGIDGISHDRNPARATAASQQHYYASGIKGNRNNGSCGAVELGVSIN